MTGILSASPAAINGAIAQQRSDGTRVEKQPRANEAETKSKFSINEAVERDEGAPLSPKGQRDYRFLSDGGDFGNTHVGADDGAAAPLTEQTYIPSLAEEDVRLRSALSAYQAAIKP